MAGWSWLSCIVGFLIGAVFVVAALMVPIFFMDKDEDYLG